MLGTMHRTRGAGVALPVMLLVGCSSATSVSAPTTPAPSPEALFVEAVSEDLGKDVSPLYDETVEQGTWACEQLDTDDLLMDGAVASYNAYRDGDAATADAIWPNAVAYLCPDMAANFDTVVELADTLG
ncbi:hypothetical protein ACTHAM_002421 [Cellulomonas soli]|uniref:hypothetical protein n=1 Tax=Cellulomonas soli TaxID=931535 RepID=UPI003F87EE6E